MRIRSPSLPELHAFVSAARLGAFSKAAEALCVTQGAISRSIARVEDHIGQPLFDRLGRGSVLTPAGQAYFESVAASIDALEAAAIQAQGALEPTALRLSITPSLASHWLIRRLPDFHRRFPDIKMSFRPYHPDELPNVAGHDASLRGASGRWPAGIEGDYVIGRQIVPVCRPADLSGPEPLNSPRDLLKRPLLFHSLHPNTWKNWFNGVGCESGELTPVASFDQVSQLLEAAVAGLGVAVVQRCLIDDHLLAGRLAIAWPEQVLNDRGYYLCYPEALRRSPAVIALRGWLQEQGREDERAASLSAE